MAADGREENGFPPQHQDRQPGREGAMEPEPREEPSARAGSGKLTGRRVLVTGGDSGIGRAVAVLSAREGADVAIVYLEEHEDAEEARRLVEEEGAGCVTIAGDVAQETFCQEAVRRTVDALGGVDVLINNAGVQYPQDALEAISTEQLERTFRTNILAMFHLTKAVLPHLSEGSAIVNSTSVTAYAGHPQLIDYAATKGAIVAFTRSLSISLADRGIRVNAVAPGPVWTPLIPASFSEEKVASFGENTPMGRAGQPEEVAPCYVFLASGADSSFMSGQVLHPNGGRIVNG